MLLFDEFRHVWVLQIHFWSKELLPTFFVDAFGKHLQLHSHGLLLLLHKRLFLWFWLLFRHLEPLLSVTFLRFHVYGHYSISWTNSFAGYDYSTVPWSNNSCFSDDSLAFHSQLHTRSHRCTEVAWTIFNNRLFVHGPRAVPHFSRAMSLPTHIYTQIRGREESSSSDERTEGIANKRGEQSC